MATPAEQVGLTEQEIKEGLIELCERGLITCTRGQPGEEGATYGLAWLPLDNPERYSEEVQRAPSPSAARVRLHRDRKARGVRPITIEISDELLQAMVAAGVLYPDEIEDQGKLSRAIGFLLEDIAGIG